MPPESPRHVQTQCIGIEPGRVEGVPIVGTPKLRTWVFSVLRPLLPVDRAAPPVIKALTVKADTVLRRCNQPTLGAQAVGEVPTGAFQNVVSRLVIRHQIQLQGFGQRVWQGHEAHERMQVMRFSTDLLDPPLQFATQAVTGQHCGTVAMGNAPKHFVQQVPALLAAVA